MASVNDETVVLGLDVDLLRLEVLDIHVDSELCVSVHHLKKKQQQLVLSSCSFSNVEERRAEGRSVNTLL